MQIGDYYNLEEAEKTIKSPKEKNGYRYQIFYKEEMKFSVLDIKENGDILLISEKPTKQEIAFEGETGYDNAIDELDRLAREFTGLENARSIREEDIIESKYWGNEVKKKLIWGEDDNFVYWLASRCVYANSSYAYFYLRYVNSGRLNNYGLCSSYGSVDSGSFPFRVVVEIKK